MDERKVAIVTGASAGIGAATALALAQRRYAVVLAARRVEKLGEVARRCEDAGGEAVVIPTDVAQREQVEALVSATVERLGRVDVMVNNAGFGLNARVHETSAADIRDIFAVNVFGVFHGCRAVVPVMMRQRSGHIFNVSSVIGKRGTPFHGAYCATKFAVCGLSDSLRVEMMPHNVRVTTVCPAMTRTEFFERSRRTRAAGSSYRLLRGKMPASIVGRKIAATVGKTKPELVFTAGGKFLALLAAIWPGGVDRLMKIYHDDLTEKLS